MIDHKRFAAEAFATPTRWTSGSGASRGQDRLCRGGQELAGSGPCADLLNIDDAEAERLGITTYKVGQTLPLDMKGFHDWAEGLDLIVVVEEKRKLIEVQIKEAIFDDRDGRRVYGWHKGGAGACTRRAVPDTLGAGPDR